MNATRSAALATVETHAAIIIDSLGKNRFTRWVNRHTGFLGTFNIVELMQPWFRSW